MSEIPDSLLPVQEDLPNNLFHYHIEVSGLKVDRKDFVRQNNGVTVYSTVISDNDSSMFSLEANDRAELVNQHKALSLYIVQELTEAKENNRPADHKISLLLEGTTGIKVLLQMEPETALCLASKLLHSMVSIQYEIIEDMLKGLVVN